MDCLSQPPRPRATEQQAGDSDSWNKHLQTVTEARRAIELCPKCHRTVLKVPAPPEAACGDEEIARVLRGDILPWQFPVQGSTVGMFARAGWTLYLRKG